MALQLVTVHARTPDEFPTAFDAIVRARAGAMGIWGDAVFVRHRSMLIDLATKSHLPTMFKSRQDVVAGGIRSIRPGLR